MWLVLAFVSAFFLGCYDISKKLSVKNNAVIPVLFFNTLCCTLLLAPMFIISQLAPASIENTIFYMPSVPWQAHGYIFFKAILVLSSWILGFVAIKHLPLTIIGPINATRPVMTLVGALLIFGERLNIYQWAGVLLTIISFYLLSRSGKKEGIQFTKNKWILCVFLAAVLGACSGLYDKYLMQGQSLSSTAFQFWNNLYQVILMFIIMMVIWFPKRKTGMKFEWRWSIVFISLFLTIADFVYFYALTDTNAMISIVSMVRRSSVLVSFIGGVFIFHEKNLKGKLVDLSLIAVAMFFLYLGTK